MIINPFGMSFESWAAAVNQQLGMGGDVVRVNSGQPWHEWAERVLMLPVIQTQVAPKPHLFQDWLSWATAFNRTVVY